MLFVSRADLTNKSAKKAPRRVNGVARDPSRRRPNAVILERSEESRLGDLLEDDTGEKVQRSAYAETRQNMKAEENVLRLHTYK